MRGDADGGSVRPRNGCAVKRSRLLVLAIGTAVMLPVGLLSASAGQAAVGRPGAVTFQGGEALYAFNTGLVLTVSAKPARGAAVRVAANAGTAGQRWIFGAHQTLRPAANQKLCLNVPSARYRSGAKLQLWTCTGRANERFSRSAPSADTAVFFVRPAARTKYCLTSLSSPPDEAGSRVGLAPCAALTTQAWSGTNLDGIAGNITNAWTIQALKPTTAGSAVTGNGQAGDKLNQYWTSDYTGSTEDSPVLLHPVEDTALCVALAAPEADGAGLDLTGCAEAASRQLMTIPLFVNSAYTLSFITTTDGAYCVSAPASGSPALRPIVLGPCVGNSRDFWTVGVDMITALTRQYQELYAGPETGANGLEFSMSVAGSGGAGSGIVLSHDNLAAAQVWTDMVPGQAKPQGNPDGSITLRPLSNESLCLAVPGGDYAAGTQLTVETCDGQVDQEFARGRQNGPTDLVAVGDGEYCVGAPAGIAAGSAVELEPCAPQDDQTWSTFFAWYQWAGSPLAATEPANYPGDALVLSGATASGGQVGVAASPGTPDWYTSEDWTQVQSGPGFEIRSVYDPALCLNASAVAAGTQLTAAPCTGGATQTFLYSGSDTANSTLWVLRAASPAKMCVAVGSVSGTGGLPLLLQSCSASQADEAWRGPYQL
jgi:hypothetical protein